MLLTVLISECIGVIKNILFQIHATKYDFTAQIKF